MHQWDNPRTLEHRSTHLSFAVKLVDTCTGKQPKGPPLIALREIDEEPVRNPSDFYLYLNLPPDRDVYHLSVDGGDEYFDEERTIVLTHGDHDGEVPDDDPETAVVDDPQDPVFVRLDPSPGYRFPDRKTHLRGHVWGPGGEPVEGATVFLDEFEPTTVTTESGEFALFVPLESSRVFKTNGKRMVKLNGHENGNGPIGDDGHLDDPTIRVTHPDHDAFAEQLAVEVGTRTVHHVNLE